jgi:hypothetical protein
MEGYRYVNACTVGAIDVVVHTAPPEVMSKVWISGRV